MQQQQQSPQKNKEEATLAIVLVLVVGFILACIVVITVGMLKFGARKQIECHCPDGSTVPAVTSARFAPEKVCPGICAEKAREMAPQGHQ